MASTSQAFAPRPYGSTLQSTSKLPDRSTTQGFGASHTLSARERERQERERQDRERQQAGIGSSNSMANLSDEQKDEINEAVSSRLSHYIDVSI